MPKFQENIDYGNGSTIDKLFDQGNMFETPDIQVLVWLYFIEYQSLWDI